MTDINKSRRSFVKQLTVFSLLLGLEPVSVIAANNIDLTEAVLREIEDVQEKYREGIKALYNVKIAISLGEEELKQQYVKAIKLASKSSTDASAFKNGNIPNAIEGTPISKGDVDVIYGKKIERMRDIMSAGEEVVPALLRPLRENFPVINDALDGLGIGYQLGKAGIFGTLCATVAFTPAKKLLIPACYEFFTSAASVYVQYQQVVGNQKRNQTNLGSASLSAVNILGENIYTQFATTPNYRFDTSNNFAFKLDNSSISLPSLVGPHYSPAEERLNQILFNQNTQDVSLKPEGLDAFFEGVISELGNIQQDFLQKKLEAEERQREEALINQREKALLYSSVGQLLGVFAYKVMGPTEAKVFNSLMPLATQFALAGAIGPMGWAAVGITVATTLLSSRGGADPHKIILKALAQIQEQLVIINKNIEQIYETQLKVLSGLNTILKEMQAQRILLTEGLMTLKRDLNRIYQGIDISNVQDVNDNYLNNLRIIHNIVIQKATGYPSTTVGGCIDELVKIATQKLDNAAFTKFDEGRKSFDGSELVREILPPESSFNISLYDSIGLISAAANYSSNKAKTVATLPVTHPVFFYRICGQIIDCLIMSDIEKNTKKAFTQNLLVKAKESRNNINTSCNKTKINERINDYLFTVDDALYSFRKALADKHKKDFEFRDDSRKHFRLNAVDKNYVNGNESIFGFNPDLIRDTSRKFANFSESDRHDDLLLNLVVDAGLISKISRQHTSVTAKKENVREDKAEIRPGRVVGRKVNRITLDENLLLKHDVNPKLEIRLPEPLSFVYTILLTAEKVLHEKEKCGVSHGRGLVCIHIFRVTDASVSNGLKDIRWQDSVKASLHKIGVKIESVLPNYETMNFQDFLSHLLDQYFLSQKQEFIDKGIASLKETHSKKINGSGVSLMTLSKLNQVVTSNTLIPYDIDYKEEIFTNDDFNEALYFYSSQSYVHPKEAGNASWDRFVTLYQEILREHARLAAPYNRPDNKLENAFFLKNEDELLNPDSFIDLMCIFMKRRAIKTIEGCRNKTKELKDTDCEPYLADTINTLNWLNDFYLNDTPVL